MALALLLVAQPCRAERVVVVRPSASDLVLCEIFNRLQGELRMQAFETILASASSVPSPEELQRVAQLGQATASVAFERVDLDLVVHVWLLDRETPESRVMSIALPAAEETPTLLALRTVELLRSALRERSVPNFQSRSVQGQSPTEVVVRPTKLPPRPVEAALDSKFDLRVEGGLVWNSLGQAALPLLALSGGYRIHSSWGLAARIESPLTANRLTADSSSADYRVYLAGAESRWRVSLSQQRLALEPLLGLGVARCVAAGHGAFPVNGLNASAWTLAAAVGLGAWIAPTPRLGIGTTIRLGALAPRPLVRVEEREVALGRPWLEVALGLNYAL